MHMSYNGGYYMGGMHVLWWLLGLVLIGLLVYFVWGRPGAKRDLGEAPLEVLQRRLASGAIQPEDYEKRKALLDRDGARH